MDGFLAYICGIQRKIEHQVFLGAPQIQHLFFLHLPVKK